MIDSAWRQRLAIVGIADVIESADKLGGFWGTCAAAAQGALDDACLTRADIDGVVFAGALGPPYPYPPSYSAYFCQYFGINPAWYESVPYGGMAPGALYVARAAMGIASGLASSVLVVSADDLFTRLRNGGAIEVMASSGGSLEPQYEWPYGGLTISAFSLVAQRHMHEFGTRPEHLAEVAVATREWACLNPIAQKRTPVTIADVLDSPMISSPLTKDMISIISDGGGAAVVTTYERARDLPHVPIEILGFGESGMAMSISSVPDLASFASTRIAANQAFAASRVTADDLDLVYVYDPTVIGTIVALEEIGLCGRGEGGAYISDGRLRPGGELPTNTHGGLLACRHPGVPGAFFQVTEAVRQLRGHPGERQVRQAELALLHSEGGLVANNVTILGVGR